MREQALGCKKSRDSGIELPENHMEITQQDIQCVVRGLSPYINKTSLRLAERATQERALRLQAWALAGCSVLFVALIGVVWQNKEFLVEKLTEFRVSVVFGLFVLLLLACLPVIVKKREGEN